MTTNHLPNGDGVAAGAIFVVWLIVLKLSGNLNDVEPRSGIVVSVALNSNADFLP